MEQPPRKTDPMDQPIKMIRCIIVDDEPLAREVIRRYISRVPFLQLVAECENAIRAMTVVQHQAIDLAFVDIRMPELLGTDWIKMLRHPPAIVLTTAYAEYALEGYELDVIDYLLKPIQFERFLKAVNKSVQQGPAEQSPAPRDQPDSRKDAFLYFRTDRKMVKVMLDDIVYIEGMKNYIKIITTKGTVITKNSMTAIEAMLPGTAFIRTHRSYIVSRIKISSFTGDSIGIGNTEIPIGKLFKTNVLRSLDPGPR